MGNQKLKNELTKSAWQISTNIKDVLARNIVKSAHNKDVVIPNEALQKVIYIMNASVDEAFEGSLKAFQKEVDKYVESFSNQKVDVSAKKLK